MKKYIFIFVFALGFMACTDQGVSQEITYRVENITNRTVSLYFYNLDGNNELVLSYVETLMGKGVILDRQLEVGIAKPEAPSLAFETVAVDIIFDNRRIELHRGLKSEGNSILDGSAYVSKDDTATYLVTEENYNNAVPCDGPCR